MKKIGLTVSSGHNQEEDDIILQNLEQKKLKNS